MKAARLFAAFFACSVAAAGVAWPQAYPAKPVRVIVPFPPGGGNDIVARIVLPKVSEQMGQSFVIENRAGAGGTIGSAVVAQSKPDGYTLLIQTAASHVSNGHLYSKLPYDPLRDFTGVSIKGYESWTWVSAFAPAGTPRAIIDRLNAELGKALKDPDLAAKLSAQTLEPAHRPPEALAQRLKADHETIGKLFRQFNVKLD